MCHLTRCFHVNSSLALNLLPKRGAGHLHGVDTIPGDCLATGFGAQPISKAGDPWEGCLLWALEGALENILGLPGGLLADTSFVARSVSYLTSDALLWRVFPPSSGKWTNISNWKPVPSGIHMKEQINSKQIRHLFCDRHRILCSHIWHTCVMHWRQWSQTPTAECVIVCVASVLLTCLCLRFDCLALRWIA